jgi:hypothetical protein
MNQVSGIWTLSIIFSRSLIIWHLKISKINKDRTGKVKKKQKFLMIRDALL